jgi:hypothetical protein
MGLIFIGIGWLLLHSVIFLLTLNNIAEGTQSMIMSILIFIGHPLALIDCINDLRVIVRYKLKYAEHDMVIKFQIFGAILFIGAIIYFIRDRSIQSVFQGIINNNVLLLLAVSVRAITSIQEISAAIKVKKLIKSNDFFTISKPLENSNSESDYPGYYPEFRYLMLEKGEGFIESNEWKIKEEKEISSKKIDKMFPKKFLAKVADFFAGDTETIEKRERAAKELAEMEKKVSYISKEGFQKFSAKAEELLRQVSSMSPRDFIEKKLSKEYNSWPSLGVEFFLIEAFASGVKNGKIEDRDISDYPIENHAYRHTESVAQVKVTNANKDPRLRLDDDDDYDYSVPDSTPQIESVPAADEKKPKDGVLEKVNDSNVKEVIVFDEKINIPQINKELTGDEPPPALQQSITAPEITENEWHCPKCGAIVTETAKFCRKCGTSIKEIITTSQIQHPLTENKQTNEKPEEHYASAIVKDSITSNPEYQNLLQIMEKYNKYAKYKKPGWVKWSLFILICIPLGFFLSFIIWFIVDEAMPNGLDAGISVLAVIILTILTPILGSILLKRRIKKSSEKHQLYVDAKSKLDSLFN